MLVKPATSVRSKRRVAAAVVIAAALTILVLLQLLFVAHRFRFASVGAPEVLGRIFVTVQRSAGQTARDATGAVYSINGNWASPSVAIEGLVLSLRAGWKDGDLAYVTEQSLYVVHGGRTRLVETQPNGAWGTPVWGPGDSWFLCSCGVRESDASLRWTTLRYATDGSAASVSFPTSATERVEDLSSDGEWLLVTDSGSSSGGRNVAYVRRSTGDERLRIGESDLTVTPRFATDGRSILFIGMNSSIASVQLCEFDGVQVSPATPLWQDDRHRLHESCWSADSRFICLVTGARRNSLSILKVGDTVPRDVGLRRALWVGPIDWERRNVR